MPKVSPTQNNFTAGELSPWLHGRFDIAKYSNAAKTLENILIHQAGGGQRRPGSKYVAAVKTSSLKTRLVTFEFSTTQAYILEFGNEYIRFYRNNGQIEAASAYELATPYLTAELFDLQFAQDADTMWIVHPNWKPRKLTRTGHNAWTLTEYRPELLTLDVAPGTAWAVGDTITGLTSEETCVIIEVLTTTTFNVKDRTGTFTLDEVLTNGTYTADQGAAHPTFTLDPFGADASDDCPSCVAMLEQRIFFANTNNEPQGIWGSVSGYFDNMTVGTNAGDAFVYVIASDKVNAIRWLKPGSKGMMMGTLGATFSMTSGTDGIAITPTNVSVKRDTTYGAANILPETIGNFIYYVDRDLNHLRELGFSFDIDAQQALDMTILADHIAKAADPVDSDGFTQIAYQQSPVSRLWCVRNDGQMAVLTRQIDQEVIGWSRQLSGRDTRDNGIYESVAIIPTDGGDDEVWVIVKRYINGSVVRYVEYFMPERFDHQQDAFFVDSGLSLDSPKTITGVATKNVIDEMEYATDAAAQAAYVSSDSTIPLPSAEYSSDTYTKLLLHCDGADESTTFTDSGNTVHTVTAVGNAQLDTAQFKFGTASGLFDGAGDYLTVPNHADFDLAAGNFTVDFQIRFSNIGLSGQSIITFGDFLSDFGWIVGWGTQAWSFEYSTDGVVGNRTTVSFSDTAMVNNTWYHIAVVRSGANLYFFRDGVQKGSTHNIGTTDIYTPSDLLYIGARKTAAGAFNGRLEEIRISKGIARWTTDFDIPNLQCYSEATLVEQGNYSLKIVAREDDSLSDYFTGTLLSAADLSGLDSIKVKVRASRTGSNFKLGFKDSGGTTTEHTPNILVADTWQEETVDISAVTNANKDDITQVIITILNADAKNTIYIDNAYSPADYIVITATAHGFVDDDEVKIVDVIGTTELNDESFVVDKLGDNTFALKDSTGEYVDGSEYTAYISGGEARKKVTEITGLTHLVGEEVAILADGVAVTSKIVNSDGEITLDAVASLVHAGLPYTSDIALLPYSEGSAVGTAVGKIQRTYKLLVKLYRSLDFEFGPDEDNLDTKEITTLFTGDKDVEFQGDWDREAGVLIRQSKPLPLNVLSVTRISEVTEE